MKDSMNGKDLFEYAKPQPNFVFRSDTDAQSLSISILPPYATPAARQVRKIESMSLALISDSTIYLMGRIGSPVGNNCHFNSRNTLFLILFGRCMRLNINLANVIPYAVSGVRKH